MKKLLFLSLVMLFLVHQPSQGHEKSKVTIGLVQQSANKVVFTVNSSKPFLRGDNTYVLHIGNQVFTRAKQAKINGKGSLTFYIPAEIFNKIADGAGVFLTYGHAPGDGEQNLEELARDGYFPCWSLGKFNKDAIKK